MAVVIDEGIDEDLGDGGFAVSRQHALIARIFHEFRRVLIDQR